jgi:hypothetical protein
MSSRDFYINGSNTIKQLLIIASISSYSYSLYNSGYSDILYNLVLSILNRNNNLILYIKMNDPFNDCDCDNMHSSDSHYLTGYDATVSLQDERDAGDILALYK